MSELIDREATVKQICKIGEMLGVSHDRDVVISIALFVQDDKTAFPTVERPHGEWETKTIINSRTGEKEIYSFCPCCGASYPREGEAE